MAEQRTLWTEGRVPARLVAWSAALAGLVLVLLNLVTAGRIGLFFDLCFVLVCVGAALAVRPREFFVVGVLPPLLMAGTITALAVLDRSSVADPQDGLVQAVVSGLANNATALVVGYALALAVLGLRQVAYRHQGRLRTPPVTIPQQRGPRDARPGAARPVAERAAPPAPPTQQQPGDEHPGRRVV